MRMKSLEHNNGANEMQAQNIQFKYVRNEAEVMRLDLGGGDVLVVRGDPNNAEVSRAAKRRRS